MWQRIQTIWLALAGGLMLLFAFSEVGVLRLEAEGAIQEVGAVTPWMVGIRAIADFGGLYVVGCLSLISVLLAWGTIFLYKRRMLQVRLINYAILILVGLYLYLGYCIWGFVSSDAGFSFGIRWPLALPLVSMILLALAVRRVLYDEALVRMSQRLR